MSVDLTVEDIRSIMDSDSDSDTSGEGDMKQTTFQSRFSDILGSVENNILELPKTLSLIRFLVTCLYRMPLRRLVTLEGLTDPLSGQFAADQMSDAQFVQDLFPRLDSAIATRLGRLISLRRQSLAGQQGNNQSSHLQPVERNQSSDLTANVHPEAGAVMGTTSSSAERSLEIAHSSEATIHEDPSNYLSQEFEYNPSIISSNISRASSFTNNDIALPIPPIPGAMEGAYTGFLCPYCQVIQNITTERSWKRHVLRDLQPYVCTFTGCDFQNHLFASKDAWYQHEIQEHRYLWHCNVEGHSMYDTQELFMNHMTQIHDTKISWERMADLAPIFQRPGSSSGGDCNLCFEKSENLRDHLAHHLEQIALFALPRSSENDPDSKISLDQQSVEAPLSDDESRPASAELESSDKVSVSRSTSQIFSRNAERFLFKDGVKLSDLSQNLVPDSKGINRDVVTTQFSGEPGAIRNRPSFSTSRTSVSLARESQIELLARELRKAVGRTVENIPQRDRQSRRFLPKNDLARILTDKSLDLLFRELICLQSSSGAVDVSQAITSDVADEQDETYPTRADKITERCIQATTGTPSRTFLLALFLYQDRPELLLLFLGWWTSEFNQPATEHDHSIPSDESMPFTETDLFQFEVPDRYHASIMEDQAIFKPVTIRKLRHLQIGSSERLPFVGKLESIKSGSQGQVVKAAIAQGHWEFQEDEAQNNANFLPGNPNSTKLVALKIFTAVGSVRDMVEATRDFKVELDILKELRNSNTKHDMILLDWGSITEVDETGAKISHSLIFELASFSLGDLLKTKDPVQEKVKASRLLGSLVNIVEALACLHRLKTFHLDIKPDNILIFKRQVECGSETETELVWKLSDFGLARKKEAKQDAASAQASTATSRGSSLPATRPAGLYQAPEIQEQDTSHADRGSDVWSMGCVTLMVLAFIFGGSNEVTQLEGSLMVKFRDRGGREPLFYIRSDSYPWIHRTSHICHYVQSVDPGVDWIPRTAGALRAALHPNLIDWSNILLEDSYAYRKEQKFVLYILKVVVGKVLLIDRSKRIGASELRDKLAYVQREWERYDLVPGNYVYHEALAKLCLPQSRPQEYETSPPIQSRESSPVRAVHALTVLPAASTDSRATRQDPVEVDLQPILSSGHSMPNERVQGQEPTARTQDPIVPIAREQFQAQTGATAPLVETQATQDQRYLTPEQKSQMQNELRSAIERDDAARVRHLLGQNLEMLGQPCPGAMRHPIHLALLKNAYHSLDALLEKASPGIANKECNHRTALDLALVNAGKPVALDCIRKHRKKFEFPPELYEDRKKNLGWEAKEIADDLFGIKKAAAPKKKKLFGFLRSKTPNSPA